MSPRERRLMSDLQQMHEAEQAGRIVFRAEGDPVEVYHLMLNVPGLALGADGRLAVRETHRCDIYLHRDYPRRPPLITWLTPVFHPNILGPDRNGGVCIGSWSAAEPLPDLCQRLAALVSYGALNIEDALNVEAGAWAATHGVGAGADVRAIAQLPLPADFGIAQPGLAA